MRAQHWSVPESSRQASRQVFHAWKAQQHLLHNHQTNMAQADVPARNGSDLRGRAVAQLTRSFDKAWLALLLQLLYQTSIFWGIYIKL